MWDWIIKKAGIFELWYWRRLFRVPWTARRSNKSMLKEINPEYTLEELMLKLKLRYFGHSCEELIHWKRCWCWEKLRAGGEWGDRGWDGWTASPTQQTWAWANSGRQWGQGSLSGYSPTGCKESGMTYGCSLQDCKDRAWLRDWTATTI